ncbi:hypothetical protein ABBQ38_013015 [Trebouxia sp. C0009 RCD-2024]
MWFCFQDAQAGCLAKWRVPPVIADCINCESGFSSKYTKSRREDGGLRTRFSTTAQDGGGKRNKDTHTWTAVGAPPTAIVSPILGAISGMDTQLSGRQSSLLLAVRPTMSTSSPAAAPKLGYPHPSTAYIQGQSKPVTAAAASTVSACTAEGPALGAA